MAQLLSNLIGNAVKHGSPDGPISVRAVGDAGPIRIEVHNLGQPIPAEQRRRLFEPLTRGTQQENKDPAAERSVGLGLYIANEIAKAHGGEVRLDASDERGTTFSLLLLAARHRVRCRQRQIAITRAAAVTLAGICRKATSPARRYSDSSRSMSRPPPRARVYRVSGRNRGCK